MLRTTLLALLAVLLAALLVSVATQDIVAKEPQKLPELGAEERVELLQTLVELQMKQNQMMRLQQQVDQQVQLLAQQSRVLTDKLNQINDTLREKYKMPDSCAVNGRAEWVCAEEKPKVQQSTDGKNSPAAVADGNAEIR